MWALLYHRIGDGKYANTPEQMEAHLRWIAARYQTVLPGEPLPRRAVCLTFDDATSDFYRFAYPLLRQLHLRALLAVPVGLVGQEGYCTWQELAEMAGSGRIEIASHGMSHRSLLEPVDLEEEIAASKRVLEETLSVTVQTFVYPFGQFNRQVQAKVKAHYRYAMRIGTACNTSWRNLSGLIYRIPCDALPRVDAPFRFPMRLRSLWFYLLNTMRCR